MKVSARNVFEGRVVTLRPGHVTTEVEVELTGGERIAASVATASCLALDLVAGREVVALVKAPWVMVQVDAADGLLSARNQLRGTVRSIEPGRVRSVVVVETASGVDIVAVLTNDAVAALGLVPGSPATVAIKASQLILGVRD